MDRKWIALTNTTIAIFMAFANYNMIIISLPAIFQGLDFNPTNAGAVAYLLWLILGYMIITSSFTVTLGRISDAYGRARLYVIGLVIFTVASLLLSSVSAKGTAGVLQLIVFRILQGVGGGFLMVNSAAILADYFPRQELGKALGLNQVAGLVGGIAGLILGGVLSAINWRLIFLVNVPIGAFAAVWAYKTLKDIGEKRKGRIDLAGNLLFTGFITLLLIAVSYALIPYGNSQLGFGNPIFWIGLPTSLIMLIAFVFVERRVKDPMFNLSLFRIRDFSVANLTNITSSLVRQGITIMFILLLEAIWLPLHGYSFSSVPFWAGIYLIPNLVGFAIFGTLGGYLADRYGSKYFTSGGLFLSAIGFAFLYFLPYNFNYFDFAVSIFVIGAGLGLFNSPNLADIMSSVPPSFRGAASGMRAALGNTASTASVALYFVIVISGMASALPSALSSALSSAGITAVPSIPASVALFSALLGYDPLSPLASHLPPSLAQEISSPQFFSLAIAPAFASSFKEIVLISIVILIISGILSLVRSGRRAENLGELGKNTERVQKPEEVAPKRV
ncbi:MAG: MFS transporter [Candidatus Aramenus sp.]|nr:MFS transporter [Candidatus Aramenus sp.]